MIYRFRQVTALQISDNKLIRTLDDWLRHALLGPSLRQVSTIHEAKTNLSRLIACAEKGEEVVIAREMEPVVRLVPVKKRAKRRELGIFKGESMLVRNFSSRYRQKRRKGGSNLLHVLLDTHALLWAALNPEKHSGKAKTLLSSLSTESVCQRSVGLGNRDEGSDCQAAWCGSLCSGFLDLDRANGVPRMAVTLEHGQRAGLLSGMHKDPFDGMLIAQAQAENIPLMSKERPLTVTASAESGSGDRS